MVKCDVSYRISFNKKLLLELFKELKLAYGIRNPTNDKNSNDMEPGIHGVKSRIQDWGAKGQYSTRGEV